MSVREIVNSIEASGTITRGQQSELNKAIMADGVITPEERQQIERVFELLQEGKIKAV